MMSFVVSGIIVQEITNPIKILIDNIKKHKKSLASTVAVARELNRSDEFGYLFSEYGNLIDEIEAYRIKMESEASIVAIGKIATQVAHDVRSPLAALEMIGNTAQQLPEGQRILLRSSVQRINDIVYDLSSKKKSEEKNKNPEDENYKVYLLSALIESLVSEKRLQYRNTDQLNIEALLDHTSYGLFCKLKAHAFKRVLSNIINNSVEAMDGAGHVCVTMTKLPHEMIEIKISDNGRGIPADVLPRLMQKGVSVGKEDHATSGSGLGLYHARETIKTFYGDLRLESEVGQGTTVTITLPTHPAPNWFLPGLMVSNETLIVILDDDDSIHQVWNTRFAENNIAAERLMHFRTTQDIFAWHKANKDILKDRHVLYLCDYELLDDKKNGLYVIEKLGVAAHAVLITSHYEEKEVRRECERIGVKLIPKNLARLVPITALRGGSEQPAQTSKHPTKEQDASALQHPNTNSGVVDGVVNAFVILIDDEELNIRMWTLMAEMTGTSLRTFQHPDLFFKEIDSFNRESVIYIDSDLGNGLRGEVIAKTIYEKGFKTIYLATGANKDSFGPMPWIKGIVGKGPPFINAGKRAS
ncbi:MAG: HAMP domain-containing histidine kinase [Deltaproteobacteria bacterium]|nr:HAMP domain-containing histidine kinase [Deltaproteobacteria bacterium]